MAAPPPLPPRPQRDPSPDIESFDERSKPFIAPPELDSEPTNPFLVPAVSDEASRPEFAAAASPAPVWEPAPVSAPGPSAPRVVPPAQGAPLVARPGATSPEVRDAHAEFRRGGWKGRLLVAAVALGVAATFLLLPGQEKKLPSAVELSKPAPPAVIGRSLPPGRTSEADVALAEKQRLQRAPSAAPDRAERPADIPAEREFSSAFKAAAQ